MVGARESAGPHTTVRDRTSPERPEGGRGGHEAECGEPQLVEVRGTGPLGETRNEPAEFPVRPQVWALRLCPYLKL